jgi:hypothetical protein
MVSTLSGDPLSVLALSGKNPYKDPKGAYSRLRRKYGLDSGIISPITGGLERGIMGKAFGKSGQSKYEEVAKYAPGPGMRSQLESDVDVTQEYFNPTEPTFEPDPRIAAEAKEEAARRRSRRLGRAMLYTSRGDGTSMLGV